MASTRRFPPAELAAHVARGLPGDAPALIVALSGGRDSVVLLDVLLRLRACTGHVVAAAHVHHGLSPHADAWAAFCRRLCDRHAITLHLRHVDVGRSHSTSVEAAARHARYAALASIAREAGSDRVVLAHHADDQAETLLLQLVRGAGPHGLAAMPASRRHLGVTWWRPLLDVTRDDIDAYIAANALEHVDDDSNASPRFRRNAWRQRVVPALREIAPGYPATLVRAARLQADAAMLADDVAAIDAQHAFDGYTLARARLAELPPHRASNLLRWFLRERGCRPPSAARLAAMLAQLLQAAQDARIAVHHDGAVIGMHAGRAAVHAIVPPAFAFAWNGEASIELPHGLLSFTVGDGEGIAAHGNANAHWSVRARQGGERLTLDASRPRRALKSLMQEAGMPSWERDALPLVFCGNRLAAAPGIGTDVAFRATRGAPGLVATWHARPAPENALE